MPFELSLSTSSQFRNMIETSSKRYTSASPRNAKTQNSPEERVFGNGLFKSYPDPASRRKAGVEITWQLIASSAAIVLTSFIVFLLGVNIVIQYRTIVPEDRAGMLRKSVYIVLSVVAIYGLVQLNVGLLKRLKVSSIKRNSDSVNYERLNSIEENIEMNNL